MDLHLTKIRIGSFAAVSLMAAAFCCLAFPMKSAAASDWSVPFQVSGAQSVDGPLMTFLPDGSSTLVWNRQSGSIRIADRDPGGNFTPADEIVPAPLKYFRTADLASSSTGEAALAFTSLGTGANRLLLSIRPSDESFGTPINVATSEGTFEDPEVEIGSDGTIIVTWFINRNVNLDLTPENGGSGLFAWVKEPGGESGTVTRLSPDASLDSLSGRFETDTMAMGPDGTATVRWNVAGPGGTTIYRTRTRLPGGDFSPVEELNIGVNNFDFPKMVVDSSGRTSIYWECGGVCYADRPAGGPWGPVQSLTLADDAYSLDVAGTPDGTTLAVWSSRENTSEGVDARIVATRRQPGGAFPPAQVISGDDTDAVLPQAGMSPDGEATVVWEKSGTYPDALRGSYSDSDGAFSTPVTLIQSNSLGYDIWMEDGTGGATAFWLSSEGSSRRVGYVDRTVDGFSTPETVSEPPGTAHDPVVGFLWGNALTVWKQDGPGEPSIEQSSHQTGEYTYASGFSLTPRSSDPDLDASSRDFRAAAVWVRHQDGASIVQGTTSYNELLTRGFNLSESLPGNPQPEVAVGAQSISTAAWIGQNLNYRGIPSMHPTIQTADFTRAGPVEGATYVSDLGEAVGDPDVAAGHSNATTAIVWTGEANGNAIRVAIRRPGDARFTSSTLAAAGVNREPQVVVGEQGQVIVAWVSLGAPGRIRFAISRSGHGFGPIVALPVEAGASASDPSLAIALNGRYWIAWRDANGLVRAASGTDQPGTTSTVSADSKADGGPAISVSPQGSVSIAWRDEDDAIQATTSSQSGVFGPVEQAGSDAASDSRPSIATSESGISQIVWTGEDGSVKAVENHGVSEDCQTLAGFESKGVMKLAGKGPFRIRIAAASAGSLTVASSKVLFSSKVRGAGQAISKLPLKLRPAAARKLKRKGKLTIGVRVTFQTDGYCQPVTHGYKLTLKRP